MLVMTQALKEPEAGPSSARPHNPIVGSSPQRSTSPETNTSSDEDDGQELLHQMLTAIVKKVKEDFKAKLQERKEKKKAKRDPRKKK